MTTESPPPPIPLDERLIADMPFEGGALTRAMLTRCNVKKAFEIDTLGCTGASGYGLTLDEIAALRLGLAGGGVGLPCFVPPDRYCLAHNTVGGLQREQESRHPANVAAISRELTPQEAGHVAFTETVRRTGKGGVGEQMATAAGALGGFGEMPRGVEMVEERTATDDVRDGIAQAQRGEVSPVPASVFDGTFVCPEHAETNWSCRFCVAQTITEGELDTTFAVCGIPENRPFTPLNDASTGITGEELPVEIEAHDKAGAERVLVYALVKTLTRKLA